MDMHKAIDIAHHMDEHTIMEVLVAYIMIRESPLDSVAKKYYDRKFLEYRKDIA